MSTQVLVPPLGQTVDTVTLVAWLKDEGEAVTQGQPLFTIETDKATLDIEAPASGVLRRVTAQPGDEVRVLDVIATIAALEESLETTAPGSEPAPVPRLTDRGPAPSPRDKPEQRAGRGHRIFVSPRARRLADTRGVSLSVLRPTGPEGAIVERDVQAYLDAQARPEVTPAHRTDHVTLHVEADLTSLTAVRASLVEEGLVVSYDDLFLYILGRALRDHPDLNAPLRADGANLHQGAHIGLAVDVDRDLVLPVVRDVDRKGLGQIAAESRSLIERARAGLGTAADLGEATFTVANLGTLGLDSFTSMVLVPECALLGIGRIKTQPEFEGDRIVARQKMWLSLTFDRRLVDNGPAAHFLHTVLQLTEQPHLLLC